MLEDLDELAEQRDGLTLVAGVVVPLPTAGLRLGEIHREAQPLEQVRGGDADVGKERVVEASDEKRDSHQLILSTQRIREEVIALKRCSASSQAARPALRAE